MLVGRTNRELLVMDYRRKLMSVDYITGGWKSEGGKFSYGCSSFRGKRATMEDFYDIKTSKIDGQTVCLFGSFYVNRHFGETNMNARSSRSHTIFRMNLVDLAGSERNAKTSAGGVRLKKEST